MREHSHLKSFVYGVLSNQAGDLPTEDTTSFKETLVILLNAQTDDQIYTNFQSWLSAEFPRMREDHFAITDDVIDKLRSMFPLLFEPPAPSASTPAASTQQAPPQP